MSTRYLIAALLMTSACVAHADVTPSTSSPAFLSTWTTGNGADVIGSGVLSGNASLIGGVANGSDSSLAQSLYDKASANAAQTGGVMKISYAQGIDGKYLTTTSNAMLVAILGDSMSAVSSPDGALITSAPKTSGAVGNAGGGVAVSGGATINTASPSGSGGTSGSGTTSGGAGGNSGSNTASNTASDTGTGSITGGTSAELLSAADPTQGSGAVVELASAPAAPTSANVPEPSSIALLAAGLFGAVGLRRRRR